MGPKTPRGSQGRKVSMLAEPATGPMMSFVETVLNTLNKPAGSVKINREYARSIEADLQDLNDSNTLISREVLKDVVELCGNGIRACRRLRPDAFVLIVQMLLATEESWVRDRGLYLLAESLHNESQEGDQKSLFDGRTTLLGQGCLPQLYERFCDKSESFTSKRWLGTLTLELLRDSEDNQQIVALMPESKRTKLGSSVLYEPSEIIRAIAGRILTVMVAADHPIKGFFPWDTSETVFTKYPSSLPSASQWDKSFQEYVDHIWEDICAENESNGEIQFAQNVVTVPPFANTSGVSQWHRSIYIEVADVIRVYIHSGGNRFDSAVDVPWTSIARVETAMVILDSKLEKPPVDVVFTLHEDKPCNFNSKVVQLSQIKITLPDQSSANGIVDIVKGSLQTTKYTTEIENLQRGSPEISNSQDSTHSKVSSIGEEVVLNDDYDNNVAKEVPPGNLSTRPKLLVHVLEDDISSDPISHKALEAVPSFTKGNPDLAPDQASEPQSEESLSMTQSSQDEPEAALRAKPDTHTGASEPIRDSSETSDGIVGNRYLDASLVSAPTAQKRPVVAGSKLPAIRAKRKALKTKPAIGVSTSMLNNTKRTAKAVPSSLMKGIHPLEHALIDQSPKTRHPRPPTMPPDAANNSDGADVYGMLPSPEEKRQIKRQNRGKQIKATNVSKSKTYAAKAKLKAGAGQPALEKEAEKPAASSRKDPTKPLVSTTLAKTGEPAKTQVTRTRAARTTELHKKMKEFSDSEYDDEGGLSKSASIELEFHHEVARPKIGEEFQEPEERSKEKQTGNSRFKMEDRATSASCTKEVSMENASKTSNLQSLSSSPLALDIPLKSTNRAVSPNHQESPKHVEDDIIFDIDDEVLPNSDKLVGHTVKSVPRVMTAAKVANKMAQVFLRAQQKAHPTNKLEEMTAVSEFNIAVSGGKSKSKSELTRSPLHIGILEEETNQKVVSDPVSDDEVLLHSTNATQVRHKKRLQAQKTATAGEEINLDVSDDNDLVTVLPSKTRKARAGFVPQTLKPRAKRQRFVKSAHVEQVLSSVKQASGSLIPSTGTSERESQGHFGSIDRSWASKNENNLSEHLVDDHVARKTPLVAFGPQGPRNQCVPSSSHTEEEVRRNSTSPGTSYQERNSVVAARSARGPEPEAQKFATASTRKRPRIPSFHDSLSHFDLSNDGDIFITDDSLDAAMNGEQSLPSFLSRVDENGSPHAKQPVTAHSAIEPKAGRDKVAPVSIPRQTIATFAATVVPSKSDEPSIMDGTTLAGSGLSFISSNYKARPSAPQDELDFGKRYTPHHSTEAGNYVGVTTNTTVATTSILHDPFKPSTRHDSDFSLRLRKAAKPSTAGQAVSAIEEPKIGLIPKQTIGELALKGYIVVPVIDLEKTSVNAENMPPARSVSIRNELSSSDSSESDNEKGLDDEHGSGHNPAPKKIWKAALKPHQEDLSDMLHYFVDELLEKMHNTEPTLFQVAEDFQKTGFRIVQNIQSRADAYRRALAGDAASVLGEVSSTIHMSKSSITSTSKSQDTMHEDWRARQHALQSLPFMSRTTRVPNSPQ